MAAERDPTYHAFISHASLDRDVAEELLRHFEARGLRCWIAPEDVGLSKDYAAEINDAIQIAGCLVLLLSENSNKSKMVRGEIELANRADLSMYTVRLEDVQPGKWLALFVYIRQWVDAFDGDRAAVWDRLADAIVDNLGRSVNGDGAPPARYRSTSAGRDAAQSFPVNRPGSVPRWRRWAGRVARILVFGLIATLLTEIGPLGRGSAIEQASQDVFYKVVAPSYGQGAFAGRVGSTGAAGSERTPWNRNITVLLFEDSALQRLGVSWPVSAAMHADILSDLFRTYRPRAIMVDILFMDRRAGEEAGRARLRQVLADITRSGKTKVYLAGNDGDRQRSGVLAELATAADVVAVNWPRKMGDGSDLTYPLATGAGAAPEHGSASPAFEIYRALCEGAAATARATMKCADESDFDRYFEAPMQVFWGVDAPDLNWDQANLGPEFKCKAVDQGVFARLWALVELSVQGGSDQYPQTCPYPQMIKIRDFADKSFRVQKDVEAAYAAALGQKPEGPAKIVFYGTQFAGSEDTTRTPTHDRVAGVYMHAMALDNLLTMGPDYIRTAGRSPETMLINGLIVLLLAAIAVAIRDVRTAALRFGVTGGSVPRLISRLDDMPLGSAIWFTLGVAAMTALVGLLTYLCFVELRLAPVNWIGILIVVYVIKVIDSRAFDRATLRYLRARSG